MNGTLARKLGWLGLIVLPLVLSCQQSGWQIERGHDATKVIAAAHFEESYLMPVFRQFMAEECKAQQIARLTIATSSSDFSVLGISSPNLDLDAGGAIFRPERPKRVAQVLCIDGSAEVQIREVDTLKTFLLRGAASPRWLTEDGVSVMIMGIKFVGAQGDYIQVFARAKELPDLASARELFKHLKTVTRGETTLIIRTDPFFSKVGGPVFDIFEAMPTTSSEPRLDSPYIECATGGDFCIVRAAK